VLFCSYVLIEGKILLNLFSAYRGRCIEVSEEIHHVLAELFPEVDRYSAYREADSWLYTRPRRQWPKNTERFLINWFKKEKRFAARNEGIEAELRVGEYNWRENQ
jgi:hypothetical protein